MSHQNPNERISGNGGDADDDSCEIDPQVGILAESFAEEFRSGKTPDIEQWATDYPQHAAEIRHLFPALILMETVSVDSEPQTANGAAQFPIELPRAIGPYQIIKELGRGGMGIVYLAKQAELNRLVALKVLPLEICSNKILLKRFMREAKTTAQMQHEHVVGVYDFGSDRQSGRTQHFFTMQYIDGFSLDKIIGRQSESSQSSSHELVMAAPSTTDPSSWNRVAQVGVDAASAIEHAHQKEVLHRDIKPSNLIVDENGKTWMTDFGLAKLQDQDASHTEGIVGTLRFMAPERFRGWADTRSDIYGLGVTLYELATNQAAFGGDDRAKTIAQIINGEVAAPCTLNASIPLDLETIILKAMEVEPSLRYQTAGKMGEDLERYVAGQPIMAVRRSSWSKLSQWCRQNPTKFRLAASLALATVTLAIGATIAAFAFNNLAQALDVEKSDANRQLLVAYENQALNASTSNRPGQRLNTMAAVREALDLMPRVEHDMSDILRLRNYWASALAMYDLELESEFEIKNVLATNFSPDFEYYGSTDLDQNFQLIRTRDHQPLWNHRLPQRSSWPWASFSPSGKFVGVGIRGLDRQIIFETESGKQVGELTTLSSPYKSLDFSADETRILTCGKGHENKMLIYEFDLVQERFVLKDTIETSFPVYYPHFVSGEKKIIALEGGASESKKLLIHDLESGSQRVIQPSTDVVMLTLDKSKTEIALGKTNGELDLFKWPELEKMISLTGQNNQVKYIAYSQDGLLLFSRAWRNTIRIWERSTHDSIFEFWGRYFQLSDDSEKVAIEDSERLKVFRIVKPTGFTQRKLELGRHIAISSKHPDLLATCNVDGVYLRDKRDLNAIRKINAEDTGSCEFDSDGSLIYFHNNAIWSLPIDQENVDSTVVESNRSEQAMPEKLVDVVARPAFRFLSISGDKSTLAWTHDNGEIRIAPLGMLDDYVAVKIHSLFQYTAFRLDETGERLIVVTDDPCIFDTRTGAEIFRFKLAKRAHQALQPRFSPAGDQAILFGRDKYVLFDLLKDKIIKEFPARNVTSHAAWSEDGSLLAMAQSHGEIQLVDAKSLEQVIVLRTATPVGLRDIAIDSENKIFAFAADGKILSWDLDRIRAELARVGLDWLDHP